MCVTHNVHEALMIQLGPLPVDALAKLDDTMLPVANLLSPVLEQADIILVMEAEAALDSVVQLGANLVVVVGIAEDDKERGQLDNTKGWLSVLCLWPQEFDSTLRSWSVGVLPCAVSKGSIGLEKARTYKFIVDGIGRGPPVLKAETKCQFLACHWEHILQLTQLPSSINISDLAVSID